MATARRRLVDISVTRWYHCISRCVRQALLLGDRNGDRKDWIERRVRELADIFAIAVSGFAVMDNHMHLLVRIDPDVVAGWSDEEVARRWGRLFPPRDRSRGLLPLSDQWVSEKVADVAWMAMIRERLQSLSWFMKCLKEPLARMANQADRTSGSIFRGKVPEHCNPR